MPLSGIGFGEMMVIAMLVLIVFGPQRLPEITRSVGKAMREFKRGMNEIQRELEVADRQERWGSGGSSTESVVGPPSHPAAAAAAAAATAAPGAEDVSEEAPEDGTEDTSGDTPEAGAQASSTTDPSPEPVIAPPTFGSDLPEEIEAQLAPPPTQTAVKPSAPPVVEPQVSEPEAPAADGDVVDASEASGEAEEHGNERESD